MGDNLPAISMPSGRTISSFGVAEYFTCVVADNGDVYCWGQGKYFGQADGDALIAIGDEANEMGDNLIAVDLGTSRTAKTIALGPDTVCAILDDDSLKCFGDCVSGLCGYRDWQDRGIASSEMGTTSRRSILGQAGTRCRWPCRRYTPARSSTTILSSAGARALPGSWEQRTPPTEEMLLTKWGTTSRRSTSARASRQSASPSASRPPAPRASSSILAT
jgi:hypothetical protein